MCGQVNDNGSGVSLNLALALDLDRQSRVDGFQQPINTIRFCWSAPFPTHSTTSEHATALLTTFACLPADRPLFVCSVSGGLPRRLACVAVRSTSDVLWQLDSMRAA